MMTERQIARELQRKYRASWPNEKRVSIRKQKLSMRYKGDAIPYEIKRTAERLVLLRELAREQGLPTLETQEQEPRLDLASTKELLNELHRRVDALQRSGS